MRAIDTRKSCAAFACSLLALLLWLVFPAFSPALTATLRPNGAGSTTQWTPSAGTNWSCVTYNDGDTRYVSTSTYLNTDQYAMEDLGAAGNISLVRAYFQARRSGTFQTTNLRYGINSGGTEATSTSNLTSAYVLYGGAANFCEWTRDPATGSAWSLAGVNAIETLIRHNQNNVRTARVTEVYLEVEYTTPSPTPSPAPSPTPVPLPPPWAHQDIGSVGLSGDASYSSGIFAIDGAGADIWGTADAFHFVYQPLSGDGEIYARVVSVENTDPWAKAGVMIREELTAGSTHAMSVVTTGNGVAFQRRTTTDGSSDHTAGGGYSAPYWVRMVRSGSTFTGYQSADGASWTEISSASIAMSTNVYIGLAVTSHDATALCTSEIDNVTVVTPPPTPSPSVTPTATPTPSPSPNPTATAVRTPTPVPSPTAPIETFLSAADSYVNQNQANTNYGTATTMTVRSNSGGYPDTNHRSFVQYDVSSLPAGATVQSATVRLYLATAPTASRSYDIHRVTASWIESGAGSITWNNAPAVAGSATDTIATGTSSAVWLEWDVTADVQGFVYGTYDNYGWRVRDQTESSATDRQSTFRTREYAGTDYDPQLVVTYLIPPPTPSATPTAVRTATPTASPTPTPAPTACLSLIDASFSADSDGFAYYYDAFRSTSQPAYESGSWSATSGRSGGGITVTLADIDNNTINGMSGGWWDDFSLFSAQTVTVDLYYRLIFSAGYEADEYGDALLSVDGVYYGVGGNDYLYRYYGDGNGGADMDTGWQSVSRDIALGSGSHTLAVGGYNSKKTYADEWTQVFFDDVLVSVCYPTTPTPTATATPSPSATATPTPGGYKTPSPSPTASATPLGYKTPPPSPTASPSPTAPPSPSPTSSITPPPAPTSTPTPWQVFGIPSGYSEFLIPGSEEQMWSVYTNNQITNMSQQSGMHAVISVVANLDNTVVYYDHWENGYGFNPQSASSTADAVYFLTQGEVQIFESSRIPVFPRGTSIYWDGMDRIYTAGGPATVTRMSWPQSVGTRYADACEVYPIKVFKNEWTMPIGENLAAAPVSYDDFTQTYVMVQSTMDGNRVEINDPWTAGTEVSVSLNKGQVTQLLNANSGTFITASAPVQVQMMVGDNWAPNQAWESRWYTAVPDQLWDKEYYCPVGGFRKVDTYDKTYYIATDIFVHNAYDFPISISFQDQSGTGSFTLFSHTTKSYLDGAGRTVPVGSGVYLSSNYKFWGVGVGDTEYMGWDWGFSLVPGYALSREYILGWARGTSDFSPQSNGNPVWITPTSDETTVYVDFSPIDGVVDRTYTLNRLQSQKVFDPDNDNTGMHIWSTDPVAICWGEDADTAGRSDPFLDLGYSCVPVFVDWIDPVLLIEKTALPAGVPFGIGESAWFAMTVYTGDYDVDNVVVWDWMPYGWNYVTGSTEITFPDWTTSTQDPLWDSSTDPETLYWGLEKDLGPHEFMTFYFQAMTDENIVEGLHRNETKARGTRDMGLQFFSPLAYAYVSNFAYTIDKETQTRFVEQSDYARWTIRVNNGKGGTKTNVRITDTLPPGFTFFSDAITWNNATRVSFAEPTVGARALLWGTWTVYTGGDIDITLDTWVASTAAPGNYINTAYCTSTESPRIKDSDTITVNASNGNCFDVAHTALTSAQTTSTSLTSAGCVATSDLPVPGAVAVFCSFASDTATGSATGYWDLQMDGAYSSQTVSRYLGAGARGLGSCMGVFPSLGAGPHTVRLRHATSSSSNAVRTRQADLVVFPLTSQDGQVVLNYGQGTIDATGVTTVISSLSNIAGLNAGVTNDVTGRIFVTATLSGESAAGASKTGTWDLVVDGVPIGAPVRRYLSGTNDQGIVTLVGLSGVLGAGSHSVAVRHATSGGTLKSSNGTVLAIALSDDGSGSSTAIGSRQVTFTTQTGTSFTALTAIAWSKTTMYVGDGDQIIVASSFSSEHGTGAGARTASYDITVWSDETSVTETGTVQLSGTDDLTSGGLFGISDPLDEGVHTTYLRQATSSSSAEVLTGDATIVTLGVCCENSPTGVSVKDFSASGYDSVAAVEWETGAERDMLGFQVLRADRVDGVYRRLNGGIILARGGVSGGRYLFFDYDVENGRTYYYQLLVVPLSSARAAVYGPVSATPADSAGAPSHDPRDYLTVEANFPAAAPTPQPTLPTPAPTPLLSSTPYPPSSIIDSGDYDGDGRSDIAVFRSAAGLWSIRNLTRFYFGASTDTPVSADYDGDGTGDAAVFRPSSGLWSIRALTRLYLGSSADSLVPGDYAGNGTAAAGVYRPSSGLWTIRNLTRFYFGSSSDMAVPGLYYSPGGKKQAAVFRPWEGLWSVRDYTRFYFGGSGDLPIPGNYDSAPCWDGAVFRPAAGLWSVRDVTRVYFGSSADLPVPAKYTGMLIDEMGSFRPASGLWSIRGLTRLYFGSTGDVPATR